MVLYSFHIFDRHGKYIIPDLEPPTDTRPAECIYSKRWHPPPQPANTKGARPQSAETLTTNGDAVTAGRKTLSREDDAKLIFGTVFSLRNLAKRLGDGDNRLEELS